MSRIAVPWICLFSCLNPASKSLFQWMATFLRLVWVRMFIFSHLNDNSDFKKLTFEALFFYYFKPIKGRVTWQHGGQVPTCRCRATGLTPGPGRFLMHGAAESTRHGCWAWCWSLKPPLLKPMQPRARVRKPEGRLASWIFFSEFYGSIPSLLWCVTLTDLQILYHPWIPGINSTRSLCMILLVYSAV